MIEPIKKNNSMLERARELRRDMTPHERKLWYMFLRKYPVKIYKQRIIESFIVDFYCASARLVIELDGSQHFSPEDAAYDAVRTKIIERYGLQVLRFNNAQIDRQFNDVCAEIDRVIQGRIAALSVAAATALPEGEPRSNCGITTDSETNQ